MANYEGGEGTFHLEKRAFVDALLDPLEGPARAPAPTKFSANHSEVSTADCGEW